MTAGFSYANLGELADDAGRRFGDAPLWISIDDGSSISFAQFAQANRRCAAGLAALGVSAGTHVAVMLPNVPAYVVTWFALARLGAVMVPINTQSTPRELEYFLGDSGASFLVIDEAYRASFDEIAGKDTLIAPSRLVVHGPSGNWAQLAAAAGEVHVPAPTRESLASIQYTSGSTGFPKGCMLTQDYWLLLGWVRSRQGPAPKRLIIDRPLSYMGGMWRFLICLYEGARAYVAKRYSLSALAQRLVDNDIDFFSATDAVAKLPEFPGAEQLRVSWISISGLSPHLHRPLEERFRAPVRELYGMTETGSTLYMPIADAHMSGSGSCGRPAPYRECRIVDAEGRDVAPGALGELWVRGRALLKGYYNNAEATAAAFSDGWFRTGDLFSQDGSGYFTIKGRIKDSIRRSGENISAREIESVASGIPGVLETAAVGVPDATRGEEVKLCLVLAPGRTADEVTPEIVVAHCKANLAPFKVPRYIEYRAEFPRTNSNKIAKTELKAKGATAALYDRVAGEWR